VRDPAEREQPVSIEGPPPLARMAAIAAIIDLAWNRIAVRIVANSDQDAALALQRWGMFPKNLAAVAGLIALTWALYTFLRMARYSRLAWRLAIASVAGIVLPTFLFALRPMEHVTVLVVVASFLGSNLLALLVGAVAVGYPAGPRRWAAAMAAGSGGFVLLALVAQYVRSVADSAAATPLGLAAHYGGELVWHLVPIVIVVALARAQPGAPPSEGQPPSARVFLPAVALTAVVVTALAFRAESALHAHKFSTLVYASLRLTLVPPPFAWVNGFTVGVGLAAAVAGLVSRSPGRAQLGAAAALWLAAGCAPRAPGQLLDFALAAVLLARSTQAVTREGRERARAPWGPVAAPAPDLDAS
jgi:hypothetical protein